jgi:hypothetical protein
VDEWLVEHRVDPAASRFGGDQGVIAAYQQGEAGGWVVRLELPEQGDAAGIRQFGLADHAVDLAAVQGCQEFLSGGKRRNVVSVQGDEGRQAVADGGIAIDDGYSLLGLGNVDDGYSGGRVVAAKARFRRRRDEYELIPKACLFNCRRAPA